MGTQPFQPARALASLIFADRIIGDRNHHPQELVKLSRRLRITTDKLTAFPKP
ncbi:hypothetical protein [Microcoleus sp. S13C4]|uniref:hypothetical protein n=1 Tax=Microcoleus sp. S13C4 TaxID=3055410 RepID=UPI002FD60DC5